MANTTDRQDGKGIEDQAAKKEPRRKGARKTALQILAEEVVQSMGSFNSLRFGTDRKYKLIAISGLDNGNYRVVRYIPRERMVELMQQMQDLEGMIYNHLS
ncbi:MAG: flagellar protein FlaG [Magnetococcales bacterium]|nr:flagellar protein FlaG [Magnetococcales bacterium]